MKVETKDGIVAFVSGLLFAVGLAVGGMTRPGKIIAFLDFFGDWDPSLVFVMGGAVSVYAIAFRVITKRPAPLLGGRFGIPTRRDVDPRLVGGAALFGVGWGLGGYCPGPGITSVGAASGPATVFVLSMVVGMAVFRVLSLATRPQGGGQAQPGGSS